MIPLLSARRDELVTEFAHKCVKNIRTAGWFRERRTPTYVRRSGVIYSRYLEETARTGRFRNASKNFIIRRVNQTLGSVNGRV